MMDVGTRLRTIREQKQMSQGEIEKRTGLLRCYLSRVENGHTIPSIDTLKKLADALELPLYALLYDGEKPPTAAPLGNHSQEWGSTGKDARYLMKLRRCLAKMDNDERESLVAFAERLSRRKKPAAKGAAAQT
jgi:transcriptional regulator with XRE-family HTH domain